MKCGLVGCAKRHVARGYCNLPDGNWYPVTAHVVGNLWVLGS